MADVQARREARRQKILQNAKKRLNRLYDRPFEEGSKEETGTGCTSDDTELQKEVIEEKNLTCETYKLSVNMCLAKNISQQTEVSESSRRDIQDIVNQHRSNNDTQETYVQPSNKSDGDIPGIRHRSTVKICKPPSTRAVEETEEENQTIDDRGQSSAVTPYHQFEMFKVLGCILLAILCRMVAKTGYGLLYFQPVIFPFVLLQSALHYYRFHHLQNVVVQQANNTMATLLLLCGVKKEVLTMYNSIMGYITSIAEDFCLFLFTFFISGLVLV